VRRPSSPTLLGFAAACAGLVGVVSALTPEMAARFELVHGVLPPGVPSAARTLVLAMGLALIWLSRSLARRKRRAWQLAVGLVLASAVAHLAKGLDFEESTASLLLLAALWRTRRRFDAPGDPASVRPLVPVVLALGGLAPLLVLHDEGWLTYPDRIDDALLLIISSLAARAFWLWLRPRALSARQSPVERETAQRLVSTHGRDSLAFFALRRDKSYLFSPSGEAFLAYRVINGSALVAGDPIGEPSEYEELVAEFRRVARSQGWRVAIAGASEECLPLYRRLGFKSIYLGDEAVVRPSEFSLEGRSIRKVRQSVSRLRKAGYRVQVVGACEAGDELCSELRAVSEEWRGRQPERGFTMAMDALFAYPEAKLAVATGPDGRVGGFVQLVPSPASGGYSLASMRRRSGTPNGLMEYLIVETISWAREDGVAEVSLNFAVFAETLRRDGGVLRFALLKLDRLFQLERLLSFNRKFHPHWRRRHFVFERWTDFPATGIAYLHAESLLTPPGPWVRTPDLAAR